MRRALRGGAAVALGVMVLFGNVLHGQGATSERPDNVALEPPPPAPGTSPALDSVRALRGAGIAVSIFVYGPGDEVFERFGHIALAIADGATGQDIAFNWGMFDFNQPNFLGRFLTGDTRYWMAGYPTYAFNAAYQAQNRTIRQLRLALTPAQRGALADFVAWNAREQNRYYRYDYYRDNCSTRVRDALNWVLGGRLRTLLDHSGSGRTWRGETARITADDIPVYAGIELALGRHADRSLSAWDEGFLPEHLATHLRTVSVDGVPLVHDDQLLFEATRIPMPDAAPPRIVASLGLGLALATVVALLSWSAARPPVGLALWSGRLLTLVGVVWYGIGGLLGTAILLGATVTKHAPYFGGNLSAVLVQPLWLAAAVVWPWRCTDGRLGRAARALPVLIMALATAGALFGLLAPWRQGSAVVTALVLPVTQAFAAVVWDLHRQRQRQEPA